MANVYYYINNYNSTFIIFKIIWIHSMIEDFIYPFIKWTLLYFWYVFNSLTEECHIKIMESALRKELRGAVRHISIYRKTLEVFLNSKLV